MPHFYTIQPDGKFAIYSSIVDDFIVENLTREELISYVLNEQNQNLIRDMDHVCDYLEGKTEVRPRKNTMLWCDAYEMKRIFHEDTD